VPRCHFGTKENDNYRDHRAHREYGKIAFFDTLTYREMFLEMRCVNFTVVYPKSAFLIKNPCRGAVDCYFSTYYWRDGIPYGKARMPAEGAKTASAAFGIIIDPYRKRVSVEKYRLGVFERVVYDSNLFDFRHLKPQEQLAWSKEILKEDSDRTIALIRNEHHRVILLETYLFKEGCCDHCSISSPHGIFLCSQSFYSMEKGDPFNGSVLFDAEGIPVMMQRYAMENGCFVDPVEQHWDMRKT
jgi:hypothetical protein